MSGTWRHLRANPLIATGGMIALLIVLVAVVAYVWSARAGQFDDLDTPAMRMLHDDDGPGKSNGRDP